MKKIKLAAALLLILAFMLELAPAAFAADPEYVTRKISVYRDSLNDEETVECRFYSDLPEIPYIDYSLYASTFCKDIVSAVSLEENEELQKYFDFDDFTGMYAVIALTYMQIALVDVDEDFMAFSDISSFLYSPAMDSEGEEFYYCEMTVADQVEHKGVSETVLDFSKYGIDIREEDGKLYFPVPTLSDMYSAVNQAVVYYNGEVFYYNSVIMDGGARDNDPSCVSILVANLNRSESLANYTYNEICFKIDNFFGFPCSFSPFMDEAEASGLDAAIEHYDPLVKELILSERSEEHIAGLYRLFNFWLCDGGHTGLYLDDLFLTLFYSDDVTDDDFDRIIDTVREYYIPDTDYENVYLDYNNSYLDTLDLIVETRDSVIGSSGYVEQGDTAMISFDSFDIDFDAWEDFIKNGGPVPTGANDTLGFIYSCLERAKTNPEIKNIVLDVSANGGGYIAVCIGIVSLINKTFSYNVLDKYNGQRVSYIYKMDRNFDGVIDEADDSVDYGNFNFAVLTSMCSFSCGNLLPSQMRDAEFMIIGERSGGGGCPVAYSSTAEGLEYNTSGGDSMFVDQYGDPIDDGVPVDASLLRYDEEGNKDYSGFYDLEAISTLMNKFYAPPVIGDVNCDGKVTMKDVLLLRRYLAAIVTLTNRARLRADFTEDNRVSMQDVLALRRYLAGIDD